MISTRLFRACRRAGWAAALLVPVLAAAQSIAPGKYRFEETGRVHRAAFDAEGRGLVTTGGHDGKVSVAKRFLWKVEGGKLVQREIAYTEDLRSWTPAPDTAIEIRHVTPQSFELNRLDGGWTRWVREP